MAVSDGESLIWTSEKVENLRLDRVNWKVHQAVLVQIHPLGSEMALALKPTLYVTDKSGAIAPKDTERLVKQRVLGYQHNKEFNTQPKRGDVASCLSAIYMSASPTIKTVSI